MLKIGDFSKFSRVSVKTLRYYDEIGLLKPISVDDLTGYRYYSAEQVTRLHRIVGLKDLGLSLEEISQILKDNLRTDQIIELLHIKQKETLERLRLEETRLKKVEEWLKKVEKEGIMPEYDVVIKRIDKSTVVSLREIIPNYQGIFKLFNEMCSYVFRINAQFAGSAMAIYYDHEYREKDVDVEVAVPVQKTVPVAGKIKITEIPAIDQAASLIHKGSYENFPQAYKALLTWVESNGYQIIGPNREIYLKGPDQFGRGNPEEYITEIQIPVKKA